MTFLLKSSFQLIKDFETLKIIKNHRRFLIFKDWESRSLKFSNLGEENAVDPWLHVRGCLVFLSLVVSSVFLVVGMSLELVMKSETDSFPPEFCLYIYKSTDCNRHLIQIPKSVAAFPLPSLGFRSDICSWFRQEQKRLLICCRTLIPTLNQKI